MMLIERRCTERVDMDWHVTIIMPRVGISHGRASNVCDHGIFIVLPEHAELPKGRVELRMYRGDVMLSAIGDVVHNNAGGVGIVLREPVMAYELVDGTIYEVTPRAMAV
jgi:hypothetical protein